MTTQELIDYYANLLILQYVGKSKNYAAIQTLVTPVVIPQTSIQTVSFSAVSASGTFKLSYNGEETSAINWNDSISVIQAKLQALTGLGSVTITGSIASKLLTVTFTGVPPVALPLSVTDNTLEDSASEPVDVAFAEVDITLPIAVQNAFNLLTGTELGGQAVGAQLDIIGKYVGVSRNGFNFDNQPVSLSDTDFLNLIKLGIMRNNAQSSLSAIQDLIHFFFPGQMLVYDYKNMQMSYLISSGLGNLDFIALAIKQNLLPRPMAVSISVIIYAPVITNFFAFRTYELPAGNGSPFNTYSSYQLDWPWLSYADIVHL